jgi:predicted alpha/beta hydrolase family esterase
MKSNYKIFSPNYAGNKFNDFKIFFIHGYTASSKTDWYPQISEELKKLNIDFEVPDLPGGEHPHAEEWLSKLHEAVSKTEKPIVLVGHSLGTRTALLFLEKYGLTAKAVFLIAAFSNSLENATAFPDEDYPDFFKHLIDINKVKTLSEKFIVLHSKDDPLPFEQGVEISNDLGAKLIAYENKGHFSGPENASGILQVIRHELNF